MKFDVVGVGISAVDINVTVTSIPRIDENVMVLEHRKQLGGTVSTALATLQRLGMRTKYMSMLGNDEYGKLITDGMQSFGIDASSVVLAEEQSTSFSIVLVDSMTGRRSIAFYPGCAFTAPAECLDEKAVRSASLLHVDIYNPAVLAACKVAVEANVPISIDANALFPGLEELLAMGNVFILGNEVAGQIANESDIHKTGKKLLKEYGLDLVVITAGEKGSTAFTASQTANSPGFKVRVADTTGAGDVYHGAYLFGHLKQWPLDRTLRFANAAAAIMCTSQEGWHGIPVLQQVDDFLKHHEADTFHA